MTGDPRTLVVATRNRGKVAELAVLFADLGVKLLHLDDLPDVPEVVEDGDTFAANAAKKAREVARATGLPTLADDSGLEVDALAGAPGVHSARYSGGQGDAANNVKLLKELSGVPPEKRTARFRCVLAFVEPHDDRVLYAEGSVEGIIIDEPRGTGGFGYDPLFFVPSLDATLAEVPASVKNSLSHRARAAKEMSQLLAAHFDVDKAHRSR